MATPLYYPPLNNGLQKTLASDLSTGVTASATLSDTNQIQNEPGIMVIDRIDTNGALKAAALREYISFAGTSGSTTTTLVRGLGGSTDQDHSTGAVVEFVPDISVFQSIISALAILVDPDDISAYNTAVASTADLISAWQTASDGATVTFNLNNGKYRKQLVTLGGNRTLALSNVATGTAFVIKLIQDGTGSRTVTWFNTIKWAGGSAPTLTTTLNKADTFGFIQTGENTYDGFVVGQNI